MNSKGIEARRLSVGYQGNPLIEDVSFSIGTGQLAVLIGANGAGKSTLLRAVCGIDKPLSGSVLIDGRPIPDYSRSLLAQHLALVDTGHGGGGALTVEECVGIGRHPYSGIFGWLSPHDKAIVDECLQMVGMTPKRHRYIGTLSDGERQKTMIASALAQQTPAIVLDEPSAFLDVAGRLELMQMLHTLARSGHAVLLSTHDIGAAMPFADIILAIEPSARTLHAGPTNVIVSSGILNSIFPNSSLIFDPSKRDYTLNLKP